MRKITFKVRENKEDSIFSMINGVKKFPCKIYLDLERGYVVLKNVSDKVIDNVIELVDNNYTIFSVDIKHTFEGATENHVILVMTKSITGIVDNDVNKLVEIPNTTGNTSDEVDKPAITTNDANNKVANAKISDKKVAVKEIALLETIGFAFDKLDASKNVEEQLESFLNDIGMISTDDLITQAFINACDGNKINYSNIALKLYKQFPTVKEEVIISILREYFKSWLKKYPSLVEKCPKISFMDLLSVFAKKFK